MNISIVIPNYNGKNLLEKNLPKVLESLQQFKEGKSEIIIVDDASTDDSVLSIKNYVSGIKNEDISIKILKNERNLGFSSTVNKGVKETTGEIIILLNTDVAPEKDFLEPLLSHFDDDPSAGSGESSVFAVGCLDKSIEGEKTIERGRGLGEWKRGFLVHRRGETNANNTLWVSGGSAAFRKSTWDKLGGLNELYNPFYWEDIDLSYRALKSGYKVLFEPRSKVIHEHEKGAIKTKYSQKQIKQIAYRNQFIFVWENATDKSLLVAHLIWLPYHLAKALLRMDWDFFVGFIKAIAVLPKVITSIKKYRKTFVKKDYEVIKDFA